MRIEAIGRATLYLGDCEQVLPAIDAVDAIVTDPPYEFDTSGAGTFRRNRTNMDRIAAAGLDRGFPHEVLTMAPAKSVVVFCHNDQLAGLLPFLAAHFERHVVCAWHKLNPMPVANKHYRPDTEIYVHAWNEGGAPVGELPQKSRYIIAPSHGGHESGHPTVKPQTVMAKILANVAGEVILDPYMGTGSTGVAAVKAGRRFIGIEREERWFDWACRRLEEAQRQHELFMELSAG